MTYLDGDSIPVLLQEGAEIKLARKDGEPPRNPCIASLLRKRPYWFACRGVQATPNAMASNAKLLLARE